ncbi:MAG: Maf family protein [Bryobacteraceae bacterium]
MMLVLASRSPRRSEILTQAGIPFVVRPADVDETPRQGESPDEFVRRIATDKAMAVEGASGEIVLGADTMVVVRGEMLAKPLDAADATRMLEMLSGCCHAVLTGICLKAGNRLVRDHSETRVWFSALSRGEIDAYVRSGEPMDKAGAYAIQGLASRFIERIEGCYFNVVGLPVSLVYRRLQEIIKP